MSDPKNTGGKADFTALLRDSMNLVKHIDTAGMPAIQRSLPQLELASRKLIRSQPAVDANSAQLFLSGHSIDIHKSTRILKDLDLSRSYEPIEGQYNELDVDKFLDHQHNLLITTSIEECNRLTQSNFKRQTIQKMENAWEKSKKEILDSLGFRSGKKAIQQAFKQTQQFYSSNPQLLAQQEQQALDRSTGKRTKFSNSNRSTLSIEQSIYSRVIVELNNHRRENKSYPLVLSLKSAAHEVDEFYSSARSSSLIANTSPGDITDIFDVIRSMIMDRSGNKRIEELRENEYGADYDSNTVELRQQLIGGAKKYSEDLFLSYIKRICTVQSHQARLSGKPGVLSLIHGYLNIIQNILPFDLLEQISIEGFPLWPCVYFSLRSGHYTLAKQLIEKCNELGYDFHLLADCLGQFHSSSHSYKLNKSSWEKLSDEYNRDIASHTRADPYKVAVYHIVGRFKLNQNSLDIYKHIADTTEDYIWIKLSLVYEENSSIPEAIYGSSAEKQSLSLNYLQQQLLGRGEQHFNPDSRKPLIYFKILLMAQLFEAAIDYLAKSELFLVATQIAVCLDYYGLLHRTNSNADLLTSMNNNKGWAINLNRILRKYVENFVVTNPEEAFHYLFLLHKHNLGNLSNNNSTEDKYSAASAVSDLILASREYELLIGSVRNNVVQKNGLIYYYFNLEQADAVAIIQLSASQAQRSGLYIDAIELYTLAQQSNQVAGILLTELSRVAADKTSNPERQKLIQLATRFLAIQSTSAQTSNSSFNSPNRFANNNSMQDIASTLNQNDLNSLALLLEFIHFFDLYYLGLSHYDDALNLIQSLHIFPISDQSCELTDRLANFELLNEYVKRVLGSVALALMDIYYHKYEAVKRELGSNAISSSSALFQPRDDLRYSLLNEFRVRARALVNFVGLNELHIDPHTNAKLVRFESLMS
jgi:nuclear pore complex protein Nup93